MSISNNNNNAPTNTSSSNNLKQFITYKEISLPQSPPPSITFIHPTSTLILPKNELDSLIQPISTSTNPSLSIQNPTKRKLASIPFKQKCSLNNNKPQKPFMNWTLDKLNAEIIKLKSELQQKENEISKYNESKQKDITKYSLLADKWKKISQDAIYKLLEHFPQDEEYNTNTIGTVINKLNIDKELIGYDEENDCFYGE